MIVENVVRKKQFYTIVNNFYETRNVTASQKDDSRRVYSTRLSYDLYRDLAGFIWTSSW